MNQFVSHSNYENRPFFEGPLPQGLSEARRAGESFFSYRYAAGRPVVGSGNYHTK